MLHFNSCCRKLGRERYRVKGPKQKGKELNKMEKRKEEGK